MQRIKCMTPKVGAAIMAAAMLMSTTTPAFAAGTNYGTTIGGTKTTTFDKYLVMDQQAQVPNAAFTYAITAGAHRDYDVDGKKFEVLAGIDADKVTMAGVGTNTANTIQYAVGDTTEQVANALVKDYNNSTEKYAKKTATLDFSQCAFTEPGVYRYIITESGTNQGVTNDADATRIVDVYVVDDSTASEKKLKIEGYVLHSNENDSPTLEANTTQGTTAMTPAGTKSQGYTNDYDTSDLTFRKEVAGNQASRDKYFEFTVTIANAVRGTKYSVDISGADASSGTNSATIAANTGKTNPQEITVGDDGTVTQKFYLQHGQEIKIQGIAKDSTYTVVENAEDYKSEAAVVDNYTDATTGTIVSTDLKTSYKNTREGTIPTGVFMVVAPFAAVTVLGGAGMITLAMRKKEEDEEE